VNGIPLLLPAILNDIPINDDILMFHVDDHPMATRIQLMPLFLHSQIKPTYRVNKCFVVSFLFLSVETFDPLSLGISYINIVISCYSYYQ
jgi:hypothetical protein